MDRWPERIELHVYHHFPPGGVAIRVGQLANPAASATIKVGSEETQMATLTVDTTNGTATIGFEDDKGDPTAAPAGASATFESDTPTVLTIATDANNPLQGDIAVVGEGTANISATLAGALEADGVTPIPNPAPVSVTVGPGPADQAVITVNP